MLTPARAYAKYFLEGRDELTAEDLQQRTAEQQYELDVAMWYGTLTRGPYDVQQLLKRIFTILHWGQLYYKRDGTWRPWHQSGSPLCASLSHRGRVMVQLPKAENDIDQSFWNWLKGNCSKVGTRMAATHGIDYIDLNEMIELGHFHKKRLEETKSKKYHGIHYGMNICMGGCGNTNPISGNTIRADGEHGHLYLYWLAPTRDRYGGLLISCEPSAPADMWDNRSHFWSFHVPDQYSGSHGLGGGQSYQVTGGLNWQDTEKWQHQGPNDKKNLDNKIIDLSRSGWQFLQDKPTYKLEWLTSTRGGPPPVPPMNQLPAILRASYLTKHNLEMVKNAVDNLIKQNRIELTDLPKEQTDIRQLTSALFLRDSAQQLQTADWKNFSSVKMTLSGRGRIVTMDTAMETLYEKTLASRDICKRSQDPPERYAKHFTDRRDAAQNVLNQIIGYFSRVQRGSRSGRLPAVGALTVLIRAEVEALNAARQRLPAPQRRPRPRGGHFQPIRF